MKNDNSIFEYMDNMFDEYFGVRLKEECQELIDTWEERYSSEEIEIAIDISCEQYEDAIMALEKIGGILYNRARTRRQYFKDSEE